MSRYERFHRWLDRIGPSFMGWCVFFGAVFDAEQMLKVATIGVAYLLIDARPRRKRDARQYRSQGTIEIHADTSAAIESVTRLQAEIEKSLVGLRSLNGELKVTAELKDLVR